MLFIQRAHPYLSLVGEVVISSTHTEEVEVSDCPEVLPSPPVQLETITIEAEEVEVSDCPEVIPSPPVQLETITIEAEEVEVSDCPEVIPAAPVQLETLTIEAEEGIGISSNVSYEKSGFR